MLPTVDLQLIAGAAALTVSTGVGWAVAVGLRGVFAKRVLILGSGRTARMVIERIESSRGHRYVLAGAGRFDEAGHLIQPLRPTHIVVGEDWLRERPPFETLLHSRVRGIVVEDALEFYERLTGTLAIESLTPDRLVFSSGFRNRGSVEVMARAISIVVAIAGLIALAPILAMVAVAIKLDSCGPVVFMQPRIGRDGRPFSLLKLRTMHACDARRSEWARDNEERITRVGRWLRRLHLDEVPQLINVLRGEMNLIGPRPHPTCNAALFEKEIAFYPLRSAVLPGITGWAQVRYGYANTLEEEIEKMRYDLYYIKNRSLALDGRIMLETIGVLLGGRGATSVRRPPAGRPLTSSSSSARPASTPMPAVTFSAAGRS
jgi:lipopolysaccharide/colanic/teichoic acid biosynthesis glycosyltransferase